MLKSIRLWIARKLIGKTPFIANVQPGTFRWVPLAQHTEDDGDLRIKEVFIKDGSLKPEGRWVSGTEVVKIVDRDLQKERKAARRDP